MAYAFIDTLNRHCRLHNKDSGPAGKAPRKRKSSVSPATKPSELHPAPPTTRGTFDKPSTSAVTLPPILATGPPAFPSYSKQFSLDDFSPIDAFLPIPHPARRHSDHFMSANALAASVFHRPRANTLAGLPEALGSFSLVASPESSAISSDSEFDSDDKYTTPEDAKDDAVSRYPSPAFSTHTPSSLPADSLNELGLILANDPVPTGSTSLFTTAGHSAPSEGFDFESFAAAVEGASPPTTLVDFLAGAPPTPPASTQKHELDLAADVNGFAPKSEITESQLLDFDIDFGTDQTSQSLKVDPSIQFMSHKFPTSAVSPTWPAYELDRNLASPPYAGNVSTQAQLSLPTSGLQHTAPDLAAMLGGHFPSMMALAPSGNGLGLSNLVPNTALLDAYRKKQASFAASPPAFYIPSASPEISSNV
ncbi:hypothetical protein OIV83_000949 [Microbotryomycetes sp. JL201]|nr:hypothetical protein OIV83_000949 [Microbotryomycetes sp. JL201]